MASRFTRWLAASGVFLCAVVLSACGGGDPGPVTPQLGTISGMALASADSVPVAGARVSAAGMNTTTAADGSFQLQDIPADARVIVTLTAADYADGLLVADVQPNQTARVTARLVRAGAATVVDAASSATVSAPNSLGAVDLAANSLVDADSGAAASVPVTVRVTPIDPAADPQSMPGGYATSANEAIESFGAIQVSLQDSTGRRLNLKPGSTATIRIPLASRSTNPPASIPLFYLDETTGRWVQQGTATLKGAAPAQYYEGTVSHFTFWNADQVQDTIFVHGCVNDATAKPVASAAVTSTGIDYSGIATTTTDANGLFSVAIRKNGRAAVAADAGNASNVVLVGPSSIDITLAECLVISAVASPPIIVEQPRSVTTQQGLPAYFHVVASGGRPLRYQWRRNGVDIANATSDWLVLSGTVAGDNAAQFSVVVSSAAGSVVSEVAVLTLTAQLPPGIATAPASITVQAGETVAFSAVASGTPPFSYQWQRNGVEIAGANAASFTTPTVQLGDSGTLYRVVVSSPFGSTMSASATLTVTPPLTAAPAITSQPVNASVPLGQTASFAVGASGSAPLAYQWMRNGVDIAGATVSSYTTAPVVQSDDGAVFTVRVSNAQGSVTSTGATLTISADDTGEKLKLMRLLALTYEFYQAAAVPFELVDDSFMFVSPDTVCQSGSIAASLNGVTPTTGQALPSSGTLAATLNACTPDGLTTYTGSSSVSFNVTAVNPESVSATATVTAMRVRTLVDNGGGPVVESDYTANGVGSLSFVSSVAGLDTTSTTTLSPGSGATLLSQLSGLTATFNSGSVGLRFVTTPDANPSGVRTKQMRFGYDSLDFTVAGIRYVANGAYQLDFAANGSLSGGSGEVVLSGNGATVGRIYATNQGVFIEVNGTVQPFGLKRSSATRR